MEEKENTLSKLLHYADMHPYIALSVIGSVCNTLVSIVQLITGKEKTN